MEISVESDYRNKVLHMAFSKPCTLSSSQDVLAWRSQWTQALKTWHSPYKALIDCSNLSVLPSDDLQKPLATMMAFLKGFFLKQAVGFGFKEELGHGLLPFPVLATKEEASASLGIRSGRSVLGDDFRALIQFDNHFQQHVVEVNFTDLAVIDSEERLGVFKSKLLNNLMHWHSAWSLLIDCSQLQIAAELEPSFHKMETFFKGFFLKKVIGYAPKSPDSTYPFPVYRARHRAAAALESEGLFSGEDANCASRKA